MWNMETQPPTGSNTRMYIEINSVCMHIHRVNTYRYIQYVQHDAYAFVRIHTDLINEYECSLVGSFNGILHETLLPIPFEVDDDDDDNIARIPQSHKTKNQHISSPVPSILCTHAQPPSTASRADIIGGL